MEANKILSSDILDILFEGKNKDYGAYDLRKTYNKRITTALVVTASVAILALLASIIFTKNKAKEDEKFKQTEISLQDVQDKKDEPPPPPPPPPPPKQEPPKVEMEKFTPPVIKKDEEVQEPPPPQEKLEEVKIGDIKQEGIKEEVVTPDVVDEGKKVVEEKKEEPDDNKIFDKVEIEASFPGGDVRWRQYLEKELRPNTPIDNGASPGKYTVYVQFIVDKEGNISDVRPLTTHGYGMEQEAVRVIQKGPKWTPAVQNGRQVKAYRKQPITFVVQDEE